jgi:hypothetical protein
MNWSGVFTPRHRRLDPAVHAELRLAKRNFESLTARFPTQRVGMDWRVKPGNDDLFFPVCYERIRPFSGLTALGATNPLSVNVYQITD